MVEGRKTLLASAMLWSRLLASTGLLARKEPAALSEATQPQPELLVRTISEDLPLKGPGQNADPKSYQPCRGGNTW